jgi:putative DNA primase/helicase
MDRQAYDDVDDALGMGDEELRQRADEDRQKREHAEWPDPEPLASVDAEPQPYPLDALPADAAKAVAEYQAYGMQPVPLIAASALGAMSLCTQGLADVRRDKQLLGPVSLNLKVVAESGERKTAADKAFTAEIRAWAKDEAKRLEPAVAEAKQGIESLEAQRTGLKTKLRDLSRKKRSRERDADIEAVKAELGELAKNEPRLPPVPVPFMENGTVEGMTRDLRYSWPSSSWWSNEGGVVVGGHGFADDARMRTLAFINQRWDGSPFDRRRAGREDSFGATHGRRLTSCVMLQPVAFAAYANGGNGAARGLGSIARDLLCWPASTMGTRIRAEDGDGDDELPALARFNARVRELLSLPLPMVGEVDEQGEPNPDPLELRPFELRLSPEARRQWIAYGNECEVQLLPEGELADVRDVAAKSAENACRLAAIFHIWQHGPCGEIGSADMGRGIALACWYLFEARRVLGLASENAAAGDAKLLACWIGSQDEPPTLKAVSQLGPCRLRKKAVRDAAIALLIDRDWLRYGKRGRATVLLLNPKIKMEG